MVTFYLGAIFGALSFRLRRPFRSDPLVSISAQGSAAKRGALPIEQLFEAIIIEQLFEQIIIEQIFEQITIEQLFEQITIEQIFGPIKTIIMISAGDHDHHHLSGARRADFGQVLVIYWSLLQYNTRA